MKQVLLLERDRDLIEYLRRLYQLDGWKVETASDRSGVFQILQSSRLDLVVEDLYTLKEDWADLLKLIREYSDVAVMLLAPDPDAPYILLALEHQADACLEIPFDPGELRARSNSLTARRARRSAAQTGTKSAEPASSLDTLGLLVRFTVKDFASRIRASIR